MHDFTVDAAALDKAATALEATHAKAVKALATLSDLHIPDGTFGRVPWLSDQLRKPYEEHVSACTDCVTDITTATDGLVTAVKTTASSYRTTDAHNVAEAGAVTTELRS